jgi:predicted transport protein
MLLIDGIKFELWTPPNEDEFERLAGEHTEEIFGKDAKYFDLKHKLASRSGTGSIPDGYVICLGEKPEVQIIEMELASHSLNHIVSQMVAIINGIENPSTQQKICNAIDDGINEDDIFATKIAKAIKPVTIHRFLSDSFSNKLPTINIIIDKSLPKLEEAVRKISAASRIIEFQTFRRIGAEAVHAHVFEPLYNTQGNKPWKVIQKSSDNKEEEIDGKKVLYPEDYHINMTSQTVKELYLKLKSEMLKFKPDLKFNSTKTYISIVGKRSLAYICFRKKKLNIVVMLPESLLNQSIKHHVILPIGEGTQRFWGGECATLIIENMSNLDELISVLKLAVDKQLK